ncbi:hypothetical protein IM792_19780 [Mucilaginibacter sp. JRF]|uniref:hypothetical protein n=1 Tax=Mucilaginibacter sp. JRF TaxID=2780088 RepID=UPI00187FD513|nr:hypothetical protein [Mucilaginibacter sp. JRF]MBE9586699.1 hypothetical protein [Mucilaginibacter sp. JRF]
MDQYNNNQQHQFLAHLLSNPAQGGQAYVNELQQLVKSYPQSGILQALLSQALNEREAPVAAFYFDPRALHTLLNDPAALPTVSPEQIYHQQETIAPRQKETIAEIAEEVIPTHEEEVITLVEETLPTEPAEEIVAAQPEPEIIATEQPVEETTEVFDEITLIEDIAITPVTGEEQGVVAESIDEEVYEEIVGIDDIAPAVKQPEQQPEATQFTYEDPFSAEDTRELIEDTADAPDATTQAATEKEPGFKFSYEEEKLIVGNIAATDYFMFDKAFGKIEESAPEPAAEPAQEQTEVELSGEDKKYVSRYHDEQMPYTFLWWLDKTRREYSGIYRPYSKYTPEQQAVVAEKMAAADALQQQYIENIFHLSSVESLDKNTADNPATEVKHKGDEIIERFIKEEPQIKPPSSDKLDNENKAKRSSEDSSELVSETLANIYADQMLYHKAIGIYRKLMLKFPEKSRYFADRIESLEKKTS